MLRRQSSVGSDLSYDEMSEDSTSDALSLSSSAVMFVVWDAARENSSEVQAISLNDLIMNASASLGMPVARVCLEQDGTEVDEEEYFCTLEPGTPLMVLQEGDHWAPFSARFEVSETRKPSPCGDELELLSNMDPDCLTDIVPDKLFLEVVRDACQACRPPGQSAVATATPQEAM